MAAAGGHKNVVKILLSAGANAEDEDTVMFQKITGTKFILYFVTKLSI